MRILMSVDCGGERSLNSESLLCVGVKGLVESLEIRYQLSDILAILQGTEVATIRSRPLTGATR